MDSVLKKTRHARKRLMPLTNASLLLLIFSGVLVSLVGLAAAMGKDEAVARMQGVSWFLADHWSAVMLCIPVVALCAAFAAGMMMAYAMQATAIRNDQILAAAEQARELDHGFTVIRAGVTSDRKATLAEVHDFLDACGLMPDSVEWELALVGGPIQVDGAQIRFIPNA